MRFGKRWRSGWGRHGRGGGRRAAAGCPTRGGECTLDLVAQGADLVVLGVDDDEARIHALRFGISEGACVRCVTRIPAGPIVLRSGRQEIAIGRNLAKRIRVRRGAADTRGGRPEGSAA